jgi:hypothetical protein
VSGTTRTTDPRILSATVPIGETDRILVSYDENVSTSVANTNNYLITELESGSRVLVRLAQAGSGNSLMRLTLATDLDSQKNYQICFFNIADLRMNLIALNSCVPIPFESQTNRPPPEEVFLRHSNQSPTQFRLYWTNGTGYALRYVDALGDQ